MNRRRAMALIAARRDATVVTLIHRQENDLAARNPASSVDRHRRCRKPDRKVGVPAEERELMDLYPQARGRKASIECVPKPAPSSAATSRVKREALRNYVRRLKKNVDGASCP